VAYTPWAELTKADQARRLHATRLVAAFIPRFGTKIENGIEKKVDLVEKIFCDLAKRFAERPGGYTRIIKMGPRAGDAAPISLVELIEGAAKEEPKKKARAKKEEKVEAAAT